MTGSPLLGEKLPVATNIGKGRITIDNAHTVPQKVTDVKVTDINVIDVKVTGVNVTDVNMTDVKVQMSR